MFFFCLESESGKNRKLQFKRDFNIKYFILYINLLNPFLQLLVNKAPWPSLSHIGCGRELLHSVTEPDCAPLLMLKGMLTFWIHVVFPHKAPRIVLINPSGWKVLGSSSSTLLSERQKPNLERRKLHFKQAISASSDMFLVLRRHFLSTAKYLQVRKIAFLIFFLFLCKSEQHLLWLQSGMVALM